MARLRAYWIHDTRKAEGSLTGIFYLPSCTCSNCGYHANMEKKNCPSCNALMNATPPEDAGRHLPEIKDE